MKRRTVGIMATAGIIIVGAAFMMRRAEGGVAVETQPAARKAVFRSTVTASGQIVAQRYADIGSSVMGRLVELRVKEGDAVKAGQIVARIDAVQAAASATAANARVAPTLPESSQSSTTRSATRRPPTRRTCSTAASVTTPTTRRRRRPRAETPSATAST